MTDFEALLTSAVTFRIPPSEAIRGLSAFATLDLDSNPAYVHYREPIAEEVELRPEHVATALARFLREELSVKDLLDWCRFVTLTGHYHAPDPPGSDEDWYDPMWDAVYDLGCPEVHGPITPEAVSAKLAALARFGPFPGLDAA